MRLFEETWVPLTPSAAIFGPLTAPVPRSTVLTWPFTMERLVTLFFATVAAYATPPVTTSIRAMSPSSCVRMRWAMRCIIGISYRSGCRRGSVGYVVRTLEAGDPILNPGKPHG